VLVQTTPLLHLIFAGIATLCSAIGQNIDADIPLLVYKAFLLFFNFFYFYLSTKRPRWFYYFSRVRKTPLQEALLY